MIYLDHNATSPLDPRVLEAMLPYLRDKWGNASSRDHAYGWDARDAVEEARFQVAGLINAKHNEIVFTSGATESIGIVLGGLLGTHRARDRGEKARETKRDQDSILVSCVEHEAVRSAGIRLCERGVRVDEIPMDAQGRIDTALLESLLSTRKPTLLSIMAANNETGVRFPLKACAALAHSHGALFFTDATQALGKVPLDAEADGFDLAAFSAHKLHGPKGIGALYVRGGPGAIPLEPALAGGGQEGGLRPGTLNVPAIVGFGEACRLAGLEMAEETLRLRRLRDLLEAALIAGVPGLRVNGGETERLANTSNLVFPGIDARALIRDMHDVAVSTRSACSSGSAEPSHVLKAMGLSDEDAFASVRFSLGRFTTEAEIDTAAEKAAASYRKLAGLSGGFDGDADAASGSFRGEARFPEI